jgi:hypothetical protein
LKNALISLHSTSHDLELNLQKLLIHYRITQHCSINISPSELVLKKKIRSRLDLILPENTKPKFDLNIGNLTLVTWYNAETLGEKLSGKKDTLLSV